ncbi:DMT family transporter [Arenimonas fontis]|uniref:DMT family transporter n=1 Tax=Arenimonas fontis TaxID=2608255 RepID=A0A5B2ZCE5_9GAMM|nr:DMT family transporter [Arenimonas fontis]KAA2285796.1 DMT family transporter [Arenimonas fontis]
MRNPPVAAVATVPGISAWRVALELGLLAAIWGVSFMFQRVAAPEFGPAALVELRLGLGALVLMPFLVRAWAAFPLALWPRLAAVGAINSAIPFALFAWAAERAPAGVGAITNAMAVLFTALVAFLFFRERIGPRKSAALLIGFAGVVVLAGDKALGPNVGVAAAAGAFAALLYGVGANLVPRLFGGLPTAAVAAATLGSAALLSLPFAIARWPEASVSAASWGSAIALGVVCTGLAYAMYYRLIQRIGAARAVTVTYLVPVAGVAWAWSLLGEPVTWRMGIACALILGSVALSQKKG